MANARLEKYLRDLPTFRLAFGDIQTSTGSTGGVVSVEVIGADNKHIKLRHMQISKVDGDVTPFRLTRRNASTGSTGQTLRNPVLMSGPSGSTFGGTIREYTVAPTPGTLVGNLQEIDLSSGEVMNESFGERAGLNTVILRSSTEAVTFEVNSTSARNINGYIELTEEP